MQLFRNHVVALLTLISLSNCVQGVAIAQEDVVQEDVAQEDVAQTPVAGRAIGQDAEGKHKVSDEPAIEPKLEEVVRPFLWKIENKANPDKPSFLFGTIHVTDPRVLKLHPLAESAFENADTLFLELKPDDVFQQIKPLVLPVDVKLADQLDEETLARLDAQLELINPILAGRHRPNYRVWAWPLILPSLQAQLKDTSKEVLDYNLASRASVAGKPIGSLEDPLTQLDGMKKLTLEEQITFLKDTLDAMEEAGEEGTDTEAELTELYLKGDIEELQELIETDNEEGLPKEISDKIMDAMFYGRNATMADTIGRAMKKHPDKSHFFAAGSAHFAGDRSVQQMLAESGIQASRVEASADSKQSEVEPASEPVLTD